jgi:hypothetical protein
MFRFIVSTLLALLVISSAALAETITWIMNDVPHETTSVDLGYALPGITGVTLNMSGTGGSDYVVCDWFPEPEYYDAPVTVRVLLNGGLASGGFEVPMQGSFDQSTEMSLSLEATDWGFLAGG